jgi:hypothetical protein
MGYKPIPSNPGSIGTVITTTLWETRCASSGVGCSEESKKCFRGTMVCTKYTVVVAERMSKRPPSTSLVPKKERKKILLPLDYVQQPDRLNPTTHPSSLLRTMVCIFVTLYKEYSLQSIPSCLSFHPPHRPETIWPTSMRGVTPY